MHLKILNPVPKLLEIQTSSKNTVDPLHVALSVPHLAIPVQTVLQQYSSVQTVLKNIMCSLEAVLFTNLNDLTLKETRQEARFCGFQQVPLSQCISINTPQTTTNTDSPPITSHPPPTPTPLVPSSSTITSSTSLTHSVVTSVPVNIIIFPS